MRILYGGKGLRPRFKEITKRDEFGMVDYVMLVNFRGGELLLVSEISWSDDFFDLLVTLASHCSLATPSISAMEKISENCRVLLKRRGELFEAQDQVGELLKDDDFLEEQNVLENRLITLKKEAAEVLWQESIKIISIGGWAAKPGLRKSWLLIEDLVDKNNKNADREFYNSIEQMGKTLPKGRRQ